MKRIIVSCLSTLILTLVSWSADAQTYSGYLKLDKKAGSKGPDSLHVTIDVPGNAYVRDTVYLNWFTELFKRRISYDKGKAYYATPWMFGVKTNLLSDVIMIPYLSVETQVIEKLSFELGSWYTPLNIFYPNKQTSIYGFSPEFRWWFGDKVMSKGYFVGLHANVAWYTLEWRDSDGKTILYQNGTDDLYDAGTKNPAWSIGATYGYSLPLDRKERWNLEFFMGIGYAEYQQKRIYPAENGKSYFKHEDEKYFGITKVGVNLAYRFSLRRVKPSGSR